MTDQLSNTLAQAIAGLTLERVERIREMPPAQVMDVFEETLSRGAKIGSKYESGEIVDNFAIVFTHLPQELGERTKVAAGIHLPSLEQLLVSSGKVPADSDKKLLRAAADSLKLTFIKGVHTAMAANGVHSTFLFKVRAKLEELEPERVLPPSTGALHEGISDDDYYDILVKIPEVRKFLKDLEDSLVGSIEFAAVSGALGAEAPLTSSVLRWSSDALGSLMGEKAIEIIEHKLNEEREARGTQQYPLLWRSFHQKYFKPLVDRSGLITTARARIGDSTENERMQSVVPWIPKSTPRLETPLAPSDSLTLIQFIQRNQWMRMAQVEEKHSALFKARAGGTRAFSPDPEIEDKIASVKKLERYALAAIQLVNLPSALALEDDDVQRPAGAQKSLVLGVNPRQLRFARLEGESQGVEGVEDDEFEGAPDLEPGAEESPTLVSEEDAKAIRLIEAMVEKLVARPLESPVFGQLREQLALGAALVMEEARLDSVRVLAETEPSFEVEPARPRRNGSFGFGLAMANLAEIGSFMAYLQHLGVPSAPLDGYAKVVAVAFATSLLVDEGVPITLALEGAKESLVKEIEGLASIEWKQVAVDAAIGMGDYSVGACLAALFNRSPSRYSQVNADAWMKALIEPSSSVIGLPPQPFNAPQTPCHEPVCSVPLLPAPVGSESLFRGVRRDLRLSVGTYVSRRSFVANPIAALVLVLIECYPCPVWLLFWIQCSEPLLRIWLSVAYLTHLTCKVRRGKI